MQSFLARTDRQLGLCLRMLYAENIGYSVDVFENEKNRIVFRISVKVSDERMSELERKYHILTR